MRDIQLEKRAKEIILGQMEELAEMDTEVVMDLIRPHFSFDYRKAKEQAIRRKANNLIAHLKDENGVRKCFKHDDKFINIENTKDLKALKEINRQLENKYVGLNKSIKKVNRRKQVLEGQLSLLEVISAAREEIASAK